MKPVPFASKFSYKATFCMFEEDAVCDDDDDFAAFLACSRTM